MYSEETLLRLIERMYDAALAPELWPAFLETLADAMDAFTVNIAFTSTTKGPTISCAVRFDPEASRKYQERYARLDPWDKAAAERGLVRTDMVVLSNSLIRRTDYERTEFYNDFAREYRVAGGITAVIRAESSSTALLNAHQRLEGRQFDEPEVILFRRLLPHLQRAFETHERLAGLAQARSAAEDVIDRLPFGVVLIDAHARVVHMNRIGQQILGSRDGLILRDKEIVTAKMSQTSELRALVAGAIATSRGEPLRGTSGALAVERPSLKRPLQVLVTPLRTAVLNVDFVSAPPSAAIFISDPELEPVTDEARLRQFFRLTPAEARLSVQLLEHKSVEEAAEALGISLNTARTRVKRLLEKTDTRRQSELVRLFAAGVGQLLR